MGQLISISPSLKVLLPVFLERCAAIRYRLEQVQIDGLSRDLVEELRLAYLTPLNSPSKAEIIEELNFITTLSIIIDLIAQGWRIISTDPSLVIAFTESTSPEEEKKRIRRGHLIDRDAQLRESAVSAFIKGMEKRRLTSKGWHSIFSLMRDGQDLARQLAGVQAIEDPETKVNELARVIRPYLQFVDPEGVCEHTGLRLNDIYRYFRHTWVNSYKSIPGRSMMILVRDAAATCHPVIGIACLGSSVVQQSARDQWIGWDPKKVVERFKATSNPKKVARWLLSQHESLIRGIYLKDLLDEGIITRPDLRKSSEGVIARLLEDSERAINHHRLYPYRTKHKSTQTARRAEWQERAETSLFRSKRARHLAMLLGIRRVFQKHGLDSSISVAAWKKAFESAGFRQAVSQLVRFVKAERVGINMMDITVCGAVAPYNLLLGGKLVCLLLCSPEVVRKYTTRYKEQMSLIASSMRGAAVTRAAQLVLLCTTSLYGSSLSQYSRVKAPTEMLGGKKGEKVEYKVVGMSEGFGSFQFSKETLRLMAMLLGRANKARKVNSIFGEGVNPLMRKIREALSQLGLPDDSLLKHGSKRVVYGVPLASNFREVLLGFADVPHYIVPQTKDKLRTEFLADYWRQRWLLRRLEKPSILDEVAEHTKIYPMRHGAQVQRPRERDELMSLWDTIS